MKPYEDAIKTGRKISAMGIPRLDNLYHVAQMASRLGYPMAECGVWKGGSAYMILSASDQQLYMFDSFQGVPKPTIEDKKPDGTFNLGEGQFSQDTSLEIVGENLSEFNGRFHIFPGFFNETLKSCPSYPVKFSLVHLDVDLYESYKACMDYFVPLVIPGGYIVFDEYKFHHLPGAKKAIDERFDVEAMNHWHTNIQLTIRLD